MPGIGLVGRWGGGGGGSSLSTTDLAFELGAFFVLDPDTLGLSNGASVSTASDAMTGAMQLTAGTHPFLADTVHLLNGHAAIATSGAAHTLGDTAYSPISTGGATPSAWGTNAWTMVFVANVISVAPSLGGGPYIGSEGSAKASINLGGAAFGAGASGNVIYTVETVGGARGQFAWPGAATPSGAIVGSLSYDAAGLNASRLRTMINGAADTGDGFADATINVTSGTPIAAAGFGLSDGFAGNSSGTTYWYHVAWFPYCVPRSSLRLYQRSLALRFGVAA